MATLTGIDFRLDGKQFGHLAIPHSSNTSAYGKIVVPVVYIRNGDGQRALISAGVHGDEFEGQVALRGTQRIGWDPLQKQFGRGSSTLRGASPRGARHGLN